MKLKNAISHYALVSSRANNSDAPRLKLRTNSCHSRTEYGWEMSYNATTWTERSNPSWHARFGLVGAAAMHCLHVIQGPNVTRDAREKIAFFAFYAFVVEDSRFQQNRFRAKLYNCGACVCKSNVEIRIAGSFCRPQLKNYFRKEQKKEQKKKRQSQFGWFRLHSNNVRNLPKLVPQKFMLDFKDVRAKFF